MPIGEPPDGREPPDTPCRDKAALFFSYSASDLEEAKRICAGCVYREPCAELGLRMPNTTAPGMGVWGGMDHLDRALILRRARSRGN